MNCCKLEITFKCQTRLSNSFRYNELKPKDLISGVVFVNLSVLFAISPIIVKVPEA